MTIQELNDMISVVCPIDGINSNGAIWFKDEATPQQRAAAEEIMRVNLPNLSS